MGTPLHKVMAFVGLSRWVLQFLLSAILFTSVISSEQSFEGTIIMSTYRRLRFGFDIFAAEVPADPNQPVLETRLTYGDGQVMNYNGFFASNSGQSLLFKHMPKSTHNHFDGDEPLEGKILAYVSERQGRGLIYFSLYTSRGEQLSSPMIVRSGSDKHSFDMMQYEVEMAELSDDIDGDYKPIFFQDRPSMVHDCVIYVSSEERPPGFRQSWAAVYSTNLTSGVTTRLTPAGVADFSPSVSPSGEWVLVASYGNATWEGEVHELRTDLYMFRTKDGSNRNLLVSGGGWPSWADDASFFFHRKGEDGWWSVYKGTISAPNAHMEDLIRIERVTPGGIHCFTPAASRTSKWVAVATRRPESAFRQIEVFDLQSNSFIQVSNHSAPMTHHFNPFVSHDSALVGYHKCRGNLSNDVRHIRMSQRISRESTTMVQEPWAHGVDDGQSLMVPHLDFSSSPFRSLSVLRTDGEFPSFSPDGSLIAYIPKAGETGVRVMRSDGSRSMEVYPNASFGTVWDRTRDGVIYTSSGPIFHSRATVHVVAIMNAHKLVEAKNVPLVSKVLTKKGTKNNAFPSPSPDGKYLVFRSSRSGWKNLYIMDALQGEEGGLWRLTEGNWTDTMCSWSLDGEWIVFSSDRDNPKSGSFTLYLIHPNGTGLHRVFDDLQVGGLVNHGSFSPDSKSLLFTTDYAGLSAEPISVPFQFQPYGDVFVASLDGRRLERISHTQYENGTPAWGRKYIGMSELTDEGENVQCSFDDVDWLADDDVAGHLEMTAGFPRQGLCGMAGSPPKQVSTG